jgi:hypothetical protein
VDHTENTIPLLLFSCFYGNMSVSEAIIKQLLWYICLVRICCLAVDVVPLFVSQLLFRNKEQRLFLWPTVFGLGKYATVLKWISKK